MHHCLSVLRYEGGCWNYVVFISSTVIIKVVHITCHSFLVSGKSSYKHYKCKSRPKTIAAWIDDLPEYWPREATRRSPLARFVSLKHLVTKRTVWWGSEQGHALWGEPELELHPSFISDDLVTLWLFLSLGSFIWKTGLFQGLTERAHIKCIAQFLIQRGHSTNVSTLSLLLGEQNPDLVLDPTLQCQWSSQEISRKFPNKNSFRASLVAQWLRIRLPMQGAWVRALVREDPTCGGATKRVHHDYWACALEPASHNYWACVPQLLKPARLEPVLHNKRSHHNEKPEHCNKE